MERKDLCDWFASKAISKIRFSAKAHSRTCSCTCKLHFWILFKDIVSIFFQGLHS